MEIKLLEIKELGEFLGYTDMRSIRKWCAKNNLLIVRQGKKDYVNKEAFNAAFEKPFTSKESPKKISNKRSGGNFQPNNDIVSKYLNKYESNNKSKAA